MTDAAPEPSRVATVGRVAGPAVFALLLLVPTGALAGSAKAAAAVVAWMAVWWVTEAAPLAMTSMLPLVLLPLLGVEGVRDVAPNYADHMIFLFFGGFVLALAVERSGLHRRLALAILAGIGTSPRRLVWGFLLAGAALSMWLSNTATALMMLPIAAGVVRRLDHPQAGARLFLAVAYGCSVGGIATLVGTPPNLVLAGMAPTLVPGLETISFGGWMLIGVPIALLVLPVVALRLARGLPHEVDTDVGVGAERRQLGPMRPVERRAAVLFCCTAAAWVSRSGVDLGALSIPGWADLLPDPRLASDAVPAVAAAIVATLMPSGEDERRPMLTWREIRHGVPWGILLLFGGGFAVADGMQASGLDRWLAGTLEALGGLPLWLVVLAIAVMTSLATELTSNTATATLMLPIMVALSEALGVHPYLLMVPAVVAASCAFMLPVATPPNAIVMGSGHVSARDLFREGLPLNFVAAAIIAAVVLVLGPLVLPMG